MLSIMSDIILQEKEERYIKTSEAYLKEFFPALWSSIRGNIEMIFPIITTELKRSQRIFYDHSKGLNMRAYKNASNQPNMYTMPAVSHKITMQALGLPAIGLPLSLIYFVLALPELNTNDIDIKKSDRRMVEFTSSRKIEIATWETAGLFDIVGRDSDKIFAIQLHETGHWVNWQPVLTSKLFGVLSTNFFKMTPLVLLFAILNIVYGRAGEWKADAFAKKAGYGQVLANALDDIGYNVREDADIFIQLLDHMRVIMIRIIDAIDEYLPISTHPSVRRRTAILREETDPNLIDYEYLNEVEFSSIVDFILKHLSKPLQFIDKVAAKYSHVLFPLSRGG
jgi:Zn-dependent protease with chaperone function